MDPIAGLRRAPDLPAGEPIPESDPVLVARIAADIKAMGPISFDRFMEIALYDPERGYYAAGASNSPGPVGPGRAGDFLTAPESHPIFGRTLARVVGDAWRLLDRPAPFLVREDGAGSGALALALLDGLRSDDQEAFEAARYQPVEVNRPRLLELREHIAAEFGGHGASVETPPREGVVLANELLDALPVHRVDRRNGELRELFVDLAIKADSPGQPAFVERAGSPSTPALAARLESEGIELIEGARAEICLRLDAWVAELDRAIERGFAVVIDYGYPAAELYAAERAEGTLRVYSRHRVGADPFRAIGRQDLTAHVDFTAVARAFEAVGWRILGLRRQAEFLIGSGMEDVLAGLQADETSGLEARLLLRSAVGRMLDPRQTGGFRVLVAAKGLPAGVTFAGLRDVRTR